MWILLAAALAGACPATGAAAPPAIALIVDDLGYRPREDFAALAVPGLVTFGILPFAPLTTPLAESAHDAGKEILLHLPMEARSNNHLLGPGALMRRMTRTELTHAVDRALDAVPYRVGLNNHMGSLLTADLERMRWLMQHLGRERGLLFVDSRTSARSTARGAAREARVPFLARDVFLDNHQDPDYIHARFDELVQRARERGDAVGIAHPHPPTLAVLRARLPQLADVELLTVTALAERRRCRDARPASVGVAALAERGHGGEQAEPAEHPHAHR
ncbi:MAG: divergent polysaccharide deacetylase family protein [Gammaproteobacteria bacterium]